MKRLSVKVQPGDIFYIPAINANAELGFTLARYIDKIEPNIGHLIEVFSKFYVSPPASAHEIDCSKRLFRPILCSLRFAEVSPWRILFSNQHYRRNDSHFDLIEFAFHQQLWKGGVITPAAQSDIAMIEPAICWRMHHIILRVIAHLSGFLQSNDNFDYKKLPNDFRMDNPAMLAKVVRSSEEIAAQFNNL